VRAYYNEFEPFAAHWLRELIREGLIPEGDVDERSITDVEPTDLKDYTQCHFFAGIGGWAYATRLARWPDSRPIWTGSPPCQPFSAAGKRLGTEDERHLWPVWFDLVRECRPPTIFGEQVSAAIRHGWLDQLQEDLEASDYAVGSVIVPASGVGALHKRDRLWFVAYCRSNGSQGWLSRRQDQEREVERGQARCGSAADRLADSDDLRYERSEETGWQAERRSEHTSASEHVVGNSSVKSSERFTGSLPREKTKSGSEGLKNGNLFERHSDASENGAVADSDNSGQRSDGGPAQQDQWDNTWGRCQAVQCKDGKVRAIPTEPALFPLADGIPNRVGILRGAGNAIVPQVAAEILKIFT